MELPPLSRAAVVALAGEDADRVLALTGGNPFFVTELIASREGPPPPSLAHAVLARVARLDERPRALLELVAMVPGRVRTALLDTVEPGWPEQAEQAERRQLLTSDPRHVRFCHELTRAAVRSSVPPVRRRLLHRRILQGLQEVGGEPADLVHHAEAAGVTEVVAEHALPAARQAGAMGAHREALAHLRRAVRFADRLAPAEQARSWEELAGTACVVGRGDEAVAAATRAIELHDDLGDHLGAGRCTALRSHLHWFAGEGAAAWADACSAVRRLSRAGCPAGLAQAYVAVAELAMLASRADDALHWGVRALELAWEDAGVRSRALAVLGATRMQLDATDTGTLREAMDTALAAEEHHHVVLIHTSLAFISLQWVLPEAALAHVERGRRYAAEHEVDTMAGYLDAVRAWLLLRRGRAEEAVRLAGAALDRSAARGVAVAGLVARTVLAERAVRSGDDDADALLAELAADADRTGELKRIAPVFELQVERALTCGDPLPVRRLAEISRIVGDQPLRRGGAGARIAAWAAVCGRHLPVDGPVPEPHAAMIQRDWVAAADAFGRAGWVHDRALLLSLSHSATALAEGLDLARGCGARPLEQRISRRMRERGITVPRGPSPSTLANPAGLTDRQLEVLALLREGLGNAGIAARLHISPRTVEHHVAGILAKLGAASRAEAIARSTRLGTLP
ncbi:LuxR family transcriptional regulator [Blastococcus sp. KM273129]|uniref:helix-turn-helix transcriptional regulator n=1 Tax=Blastococcus sp. KM273129 TaxID=2570315 RepID=UPI001F017918|nr:LuxR family transcriptional regulator [Blastococcus sp. KM273129]MCF6735733.1 hypothetical protein [Blastococcus sp. KM273129]